MRLKLRDVTFVGTVALWVEAQALCERAPSLISSPYTWIVTEYQYSQDCVRCVLLCSEH